ncbi:HalOD1 output domain-containing protein [Halobellus ruber]|uniref:Halobacterial output domain-containing protein n=1 Tax=Halobellus ruber TaxID=2761102 RepID=A0A7J9SH21_9EURY|nr:HalOD1 output domain-containing protein [Halobellus ruber]MBB6646240.1 hypothetical protein [Halobellus ruber]
MSERQRTSSERAQGWETDTKLVREFPRPVSVADAVTSTVSEAAASWPRLSETPPLSQFVDVEKLNGLFKTKATDDSRWLPSAVFRFQGCRVTVLYGRYIRVMIEQNF